MRTVTGDRMVYMLQQKLLAQEEKYARLLAASEALFGDMQHIRDFLSKTIPWECPYCKRALPRRGRHLQPNSFIPCGGEQSGAEDGAPAPIIAPSVRRARRGALTRR